MIGGGQIRVSPCERLPCGVSNEDMTFPPSGLSSKVSLVRNEIIVNAIDGNIPSILCLDGLISVA
jgi:hypothetical protein